MDFGTLGRMKLSRLWTKMWCRQQPGVIGVALYQGRLYVCELYQEQTGWSVRHHYNIVLESGEDIEAAAGRLAVHCLQEGMEKDPVIVCLPLEKIFYYKKKFPRLSTREMREAVYWDMETEIPFASEGFFFAYQAVGQAAEQDFLLAAVAKETVKGWSTPLAENELCLQGVTAFLDAGEAAEQKLLGRQKLVQLPEGENFSHPGWQQALWAALAGPDSASMDFLPPQAKPDRYAWGRLGYMVLAAGLFVMLCMYGSQIWQLHALEQRDRADASRMSLLRDVLSAQDNVIKLHERIGEKEAILRDLSQGTVSGYSLLVHSGTLVSSGTWLEHLSWEGDTAIIKGRSSDYESLAEFIHLFEQDDYFTHPPLLQDSVRQDDGSILFTAQLFL